MPRFTLHDFPASLKGLKVIIIVSEGAIPVTVYTYDSYKALEADLAEYRPLLNEALDDRGLEPSDSILDDMNQCSDGQADTYNFYVMTSDD
jgi:hypothetical protein